MGVPLLEVRNATKIFRSRTLFGQHRDFMALQDFTLTIEEEPARIVTIAGESGSGKTTLANVILGFLTLTSGQILFRGRDISRLSKREVQVFRRQVQAVFQDPYESYNPFYKVGHIFDLALRNFSLSRSQREARHLVEDALRVVGLRAEEIINKYPHQLSGGQRQRVMMARAYLLKPALIVADEPVSMVDASLRALILETMLKLRDEHGISFLYITHDLSTAYQIGDAINVLYQGLAAEKGFTRDVIEAPHHPYVKMLIDSVPTPDPSHRWAQDGAILSVEETSTRVHRGCRFYPRCPQRMDRCLERQPPLYHVQGDDHQAACYLYE